MSKGETADGTGDRARWLDKVLEVSLNIQALTIISVLEVAPEPRNGLWDLSPMNEKPHSVSLDEWGHEPAGRRRFGRRLGS